MPVRTDGCTQEMRLKSTAPLSETKHSLSGRSSHMPPHSSTERLTRLTRPFQSPLFTSSPQEKSIWQHPCPPLFPAVTHLLSLHQSAEKLCWGRLHAPPHTPSTHTHSFCFDGPINSEVFNSFGHHNPSSSKALSFFSQGGGRETTGC